MEKDVAEILKQALKLSPEGRAAIAGALLESIDQTLDSEAKTMWEEEILLRIREIDKGEVELVPWAEARRCIVG